MKFNRALTVDVAVADPEYVTVIAPVTLGLPAGGSVATNCTPIDNAAGPEPDVGLTVSHGAFETAVQVTVLCAPVWTMFTVCGGVWDVNDVPEFTAPKFSDAWSTVIVGGPVGAVGTTVNGTPLLNAPPTVTVTFPVVAPLGTVVTMLVADHDVGVAARPLNFTTLVSWVDPKCVPVIVTAAPIAPLVGDRELIVGGSCTAFTVTVKDRVALNAPSLRLTVIIAVPD
jgi:hypothetical protein